MITAKFTGNFLDVIARRIEAWSSHPTISATITVPPELAWWYYQEWGIDHEYEITGPDGVAFPGRDGTTKRFSSVIHPGLQGTHTVNTVRERMESSGTTEYWLQTIFRNGRYEPGATKEQFLSFMMPKIKQEIVELMEQTLRGRRAATDSKFPKQAGKLEGRTASEVFDENATIVPD